MEQRKHKLSFPGTVQPMQQAAGTAWPLRMTPGERTTHADPAEDTLQLTDLMLTLQNFLGAILGGIAVSIQVGTIFICASMMLLGPSFVLGLLPQ